jgi:hypothetical protein
MPFELFRLAIAERKQVICIYKGYYREVCPYVLVPRVIAFDGAL